jgi:hypothetical protein
MDLNRRFQIFDLLILTLGVAFCLTIRQWWGTLAFCISLAIGLALSFSLINRINLDKYCIWLTDMRPLRRLVSAFQVSFALTVVTIISLVVSVILFAGRGLSIEVICSSVLQVNLFSHALGLGFPKLGSSLSQLNRFLAHVIFGRT